jgi:hypothetical protein
MPLHTHPLPTNLSWLLSSGVLKFSAESINGMDLAALSPLHQLPAIDALRIQGAWPHAIGGPVQAITSHFGGGGLAAEGTQGDGTLISIQEPKQDVRDCWPGSALCRGVLGKWFWDFRPWKFILDSGGARVGGVHDMVRTGEKHHVEPFFRSNFQRSPAD